MVMKLILRIFISFFCVNLYAQAPVINLYDVNVIIEKDAQLFITERIDVTTDGKQIKRGIYRDLPTQYKTVNGYDFDIGFRLISVKKNGVPEPYHVKNLSNGVRIYMGDKNKLLAPSNYRYEITYSINRAIGFFTSHDELYWNVTGNGWAFPIEKAKASVQLPENGKVTKAMAYTGFFGSRSQNYTKTDLNTNEIEFATTNTLLPKQGLTIVVGFPKGVVQEPDMQTKIGYFLHDNGAFIFLFIGYIGLLLFYIISWHHLGRDPQKNAVIPLFEPPSGFSPQALRFIKKMRYDNKMLTSAIVNMAVKKYLTIEKKEGRLLSKSSYTLKRISHDDSNLSFPEKAIAQALFASSEKFVLSKNNHEVMEIAISDFKKSLKEEFQAKYFVTNRPIIIIGFLISMVCFIPLIMSNPSLLFPAAFIGFFSFILLKTLLDSLRSFQGSGISFQALAPLIATTIFAIIFISIIPKDFFVKELDMCLIAGLFLATNALFNHLLKRPTLAGAKVINQARGFELFLSAAEKDRLNFRNPPDKTPELFERFLPFALALDLEQKWSEQFANVLAKAQYKPQWYVGTGALAGFSAHTFGQSFSQSFNSAISSSSTSPGSSSGFSGGGGSGGGGGGGGGGGW
jgi:uncharacterized membrane protein YgcG